MKVIALNGSPRLIGNTSTAVNIVLDELEKEGIEVEHIQVYESTFIPCNDCGSCDIRGDGRCINENDPMNDIMDAMLEADGIILASPTYFGSVTGQMKMLLERIGLSSITAKNQLKRKVGVAIAVQGRSGGDSVYSELVNFMLDNQMLVCTGSSKTILIGEKPSDLANDKKGMAALKDLGKEMSWLISQLRK